MVGSLIPGFLGRLKLSLEKKEEANNMSIISGTCNLKASSDRSELSK